jgi:hypothetical protein
VTPELPVPSTVGGPLRRSRPTRSVALPRVDARATQLEHRCRAHGCHVVLTLPAGFTRRDVPALTEGLEAATSGPWVDVILDLTAVPVLPPVAVAALATLRARLSGRRRDLLLVDPAGALPRSTSGNPWLEGVPVYATVAAAVGAVPDRAPADATCAMTCRVPSLPRQPAARTPAR